MLGSQPEELAEDEEMAPAFPAKIPVVTGIIPVVTGIIGIIPVVTGNVCPLEALRK